MPVWVAVGGTNSVAVAVGCGGPGGSATINGRNPLMAKVCASTERIQPRRPNQPIRVTIASPIHARFDMMNSIPRLVVQTAACSLSGEGKRVILELIVKLNCIINTYNFGEDWPRLDADRGRSALVGRWPVAMLAVVVGCKFDGGFGCGGLPFGMDADRFGTLLRFPHMSA